MTVASPVLATRLLGRSRVASIAAVLAFTALTAIAAQFSFRIPPIEVPFTLQTGVVLLAGGALGANRGFASQLLYVLLGGFGLPIFAEASGGLGVFGRATGGYLIGFLVASFVVGKLAERHHDRRFVTGFGAFTLGSLIIYVFGVIGLMINLNLTLGEAVANGVVPFVFWDVLKALVAGLLLTGAWKISDAAS
jgi:biotin transport system substrate-specific component